VVLYWFLINIIYLTFRTYFRRIYLINLNLIPKNKPVLIAPNHPNSFIDGVLLSVLLRRKLNIMARGDVFSKPLTNWALRSMRVLPIFRTEDSAGLDQNAKNQQTFDECYEIFKKKGMVVIFPEGICVSERRLRPMKKGAAKMAFEAIEKYPEMDLQILPVGMNYSNPGHFREEVCINFGHPIPVKEYKELIQSGKQSKAINDLNSRLYEAMEREMVIIKNPSNDLVGGYYLQMARNQYKPAFFGYFKKTKQRFLAEKRAANDLNHLSENNPESFENFRRKVTDYFVSLKELKIQDKYFAIQLYEKILYLVFTLVFAVPSIIGMILNFLPVYLSTRIASRKVKKIEFYDSVNIGAGTLLSFSYFMILWMVGIPFFGWKSILVAISIRLLGYLYWYWLEAALNTKYWMIVELTSKGNNMNKPLQSQRKFILNYFG